MDGVIAEAMQAASARSESRKERCVPWAEFEPLLNQIRNHYDCNLNEALRAIGYAGGTMLSDWRKANMIPQLAVNAAQGFLGELRVPKALIKIRQFELEELGELLELTLRATEGDVKRRYIAKLAKLIAEAQQ